MGTSMMFECCVRPCTPQYEQQLHKGKTLSKSIELEKIEGMICAPFTAFHDDGELNVDVIPIYTEMMTNCGMAGVFVNGSSGEGYLMTDAERSASQTCAGHWCMGYQHNGAYIPNTFAGGRVGKVL